jgi:hypothetical protein
LESQIYLSSFSNHDEAEMNTTLDAIFNVL